MTRYIMDIHKIQLLQSKLGILERLHKLVCLWVVKVQKVVKIVTTIPTIAITTEVMASVEVVVVQEERGISTGEATELTGRDDMEDTGAGHGEEVT